MNEFSVICKEKWQVLEVISSYTLRAANLEAKAKYGENISVVYHEDETLDYY